MEEMNTDYFCEYLKQNGISERVIAVFRGEQVCGEIFPDLTEGDLREMGLNIGDRKVLLHLQRKLIPEKTQVSHARDIIIIQRLAQSSL